MKVKKFDKEVDSDEWNQFLAISKNGSFLFHRDFMDYHSERFVDHSLMIYQEDKLVCIVPANLANNNLISHQGLTYGGIILPNNIKLNKVIHIFYTILKYLNSLNISYFFLKSIPSFFCKYVTDDLEYILFLLEAVLYRRDSAIVIDYSERLKYSDNIRREAISAEKKGAFLRYDDDFEVFWNEVLTPNLIERFKVNPVHTFEEISILKKNFPKNIIHINTYLGDRITAGTTLFIHNKIVHCQYISSTEEGRKKGCLNYLFLSLINNYSVDYDYFDFGIVNEEDGKYINNGMLFWKEGFGGRTRKHDFFKIKTSHYDNLDKYLNKN